MKGIPSCDIRRKRIVGLYDPGPEKTGKDAGDLAGAGSSGAAVNDGRSGLLRRDADVVLHCSLQRYNGLDFERESLANCDGFVEILDHNKNVITATAL